LQSAGVKERALRQVALGCRLERAPVHAPNPAASVTAIHGGDPKPAIIYVQALYVTVLMGERPGLLGVEAGDKDQEERSKSHSGAIISPGLR
jgi:hypothetical protein